MVRQWSYNAPPRTIWRIGLFELCCHSFERDHASGKRCEWATGAEGNLPIPLPFRRWPRWDRNKATSTVRSTTTQINSVSVTFPNITISVSFGMNKEPIWNTLCGTTPLVEASGSPPRHKLVRIDCASGRSTSKQCHQIKLDFQINWMMATRMRFHWAWLHRIYSIIFNWWMNAMISGTNENTKRFYFCSKMVRSWWLHKNKPNHWIFVWKSSMPMQLF